MSDTDLDIRADDCQIDLWKLSWNRSFVEPTAQDVGLLWLRPEFVSTRRRAFEVMIENRQAFSNKRVYESFVGYAESQLNKMGLPRHRAYTGAKRKELVERYGYDCKNAAHSVRLLRMGSSFSRPES